ncbi:MAG: hypothetical protein ACYC77_00855 [Coriobacteriia bacterium]
MFLRPKESPVVTITRSLPVLQEYYAEAPELFSAVLNARSQFEANLALDIMRETMPERVLIAAVNLREVLLALPAYPCTMAVDDQTLAKIAGMRKDRAMYRKRIKGARNFELGINTAGNFVFDLIVEVDGRSLLWVSPTPATDVINSDIVPHLVENDRLIRAIIELANDMGLVFNPPFYLSLEDWNMEHCQQTLSDVQALF